MDTKNNECRPGSVCARSARGLGGCGAGECKPPADQRQVREDSQGLGEPGRLSPTAGVGVVQPPSQQDIAEALLQWPYRTGSSVCPLCGHDTPHDHTPREITIYRNGVKWGQRNGTEPWPGKDHQGVEKDGQDDAGPTGSACWVGADQHHQHRARQPDPDGADHQRHSGRDGLSGGSEVPSEVTDRAPAVGINGLTEAETSATASVMGIAGVGASDSEVARHQTPMPPKDEAK